ncbi:hypothetical protein [Streptomyces albipurpureus]|uniref:Uncharacterized protein n=1 Tax=Streptomyces albipurpureus TaxID=2897419 RepID=A0ABT0UVQ9_9ACTN|nr:hypothetical protein [Streptomyces sp. CWNU-1]MCM2392550.1 hypothetical protein [Streptomyces sp. CWNU-1]
MRPQIWIADVVRALEVTQGEEERARVVELLGFASTTAPQSGGDLSPVRPLPLDQGFDSASTDQRAPHQDDTPLSPTGDEQPETSGGLDDLRLLAPVRTQTPSQAPDPVEPLALPSSERVQGPHLPLLVPHWTSAILQAALAQKVAEGPIDIDALIDSLAHGRPITRLPRRPVPTLRYGVQVLVDRGAGMQPFRRDQDHLVRQLRSIVGAELVEVGYFADLPQRGTGPGARWTRTTYAPPASGKRILLLSDLGLGRPPYAPEQSEPSDWEDFVELVTRAGCQPIALSPYPPDRWPAWMTRLLPLVSWDRSTTTGWVSARMP